MKKFCLTGYPLGHSMSPTIHRELFKIKGIDGTYELNEISPEDLSRGADGLKEYDGFNVTIPHKTAIIPFLDALSDRAKLFGAVNTVKVKDGKMQGYNTDCFGFLRALESAGITLGGKVLLCGSGGVSRMFAFESVLAKSDLTMAVRDDDIAAAELIKSEIKEKLSADINVIRLSEVSGEYDLMINGTPVGMFPKTDACILPESCVRKCGAVFDAVYNPTQTVLIKYAKNAGAKYSNGLPMLVWQAAVAQEIWLDTKFTAGDIEKVLQITQKEMEKL